MPLHLPSRLAVLTLTAPTLVDAIRERVEGHRPWDQRPDDAIRAGVLAAAERGLGSVPLHQIRAHLDNLAEGTAVGWSGVEDDEQTPDWPRHARDEDRRPLLVRALTLLADRLLVWNHGQFRLRASTLLEFQQLAGEVAPDQLLMLAAAAERGVDGHLVSRPRRLGRREFEAMLVSPLIPPVDLPVVDALAARGLAEVHRHAGGAAQPALLWLHLLADPGALSRAIAEHETPDQALRRALLEQGARLRDARHLRALLVEALHRIEGEAGDRDGSRGWGEWARDVSRTLAMFGEPIRYGESPGHSTERDPAVRLPGGRLRAPASERSLLYHAFRHLLRPAEPVRGRAEAPPEEPFLLALHTYLLVQNEVTRALIQPKSGQEGLQRFVRDYYRGPLAHGRGDRGHDALREAAQTGRVRWLETRVAPKGAAGKVAGLLDAVRRLAAPGAAVRLGLVEPATPCDVPRGHAPAVGVVLHFLREPDRALVSASLDSRLGVPPRFAALRAKAWQQTFEVMALDGAQHLAPYLVGLDVAGDEIETPVEVFAPMIRFLRSPFRRRRHVEALVGPLPVVPPLALTCHAGEDFRHLLSGMRAVDETLRFLAMRRGDRVGHGLALGIEPERWAERVGLVVSMPLEERVDDLVWFVDRLARHPDLAHIARQAERELAGLARRLYHAAERRGLDVGRWDLLYRAWCWRRCDPSTDGGGRRAAALPSDLRLFLAAERQDAADELGEDARALWDVRNRDGAVRRDGAALIQVPVRPSWLPAIRRVQDDLVATLVRRNIAIEINPSSNVAVGPLDDLTEHPVFRWFPPGSSRSAAHPFVAVGSDDPGIFATELLHEYAYLARAAEARGAAPRQVADWLEDLRQTSVMFSFLPRTGESGAGG